MGQRELATVRMLLAGHARDRLGRTTAIFACAELGLCRA